ncbi:Uncharacterised protein [Serratia entomophila]|jgi:hypothetical protein|uniref:hypothetical protein n=1 Tax=Serratia entomophila TaxID=42906 RepID=UPI001F4458D0|nr:hypothetical protein [Serratia entomophila]UIW19705.1 hypothetical protein KHA73_07115 [Serratia entomophila]CAI0712492.1 Uncharacterised protein [Serratia entomophila]CAI0780560.1 Uncharacterised protein [Serratia entomophila]CAI0780861.1 Uncharacterised protein [Serratia entomophila]CAI0781078.1 Uncharacterised protein [Serratia entomophila]
MKYVALSGDSYIIFQLPTMLGGLFALGLILAVVVLFARRYPLCCALMLIIAGISCCIALLADELNIVMRNPHSAPVSSLRFSLPVAMAFAGGSARCHLGGEGKFA